MSGTCIDNRQLFQLSIAIVINSAHLYLSRALDHPVHGLGAAVVELLLGLQVGHLDDHVHDLLLARTALGQECHLQN